MKIKNIKFNWKMALFLGLIITLFSSCEVKAADKKDFISLESTSETKTRPLEFWNNLLNEYFKRTDIDLSTFEDSENFLNNWLLNKTNYGQVLIPMNDGRIYVSVGYDKSVNIIEEGKRGYYIIGARGYVIDVNEKTILNQSGLYERTLLYLNSSLNKFLEEGNLEEDYTSDDYKRSLIYNYCLYFNGYIKNRDNLILNEQKYNKNNTWSYTEDNIFYEWSGEILLYKDFFEVKNFYTNSEDYSLYLLRYKVNTQFGEFILPDNYSWYEISRPNISNKSQIFQISNLSNAEENYNYVYAIGIGTSDTPDLIRSEWFDSDYNLSDFMSSPSFRLRYYVQDLPDFFIKDSGTNPSGDNIGNLGNITNTSGDVTGNINLGDIVGSGETIAGSITLEDITSKIDFIVINNPYTELWNAIINGFKEALTSRNPKSISFNIRETKIIVNSDDIMLPQNEIKVFLSLFTNTAMLMAIFIQIQKIIIKAQEGDISSLLSVADEDIHFYDDMQMM